MFGKKKNEDDMLASWTHASAANAPEVNPVRPGEMPESVPPPSPVAAVSTAPSASGPMMPTGGFAMVPGQTVIDARNVPGLKQELLKAIADAQSGNLASAAELQQAMMHAMSAGSVLTGQSPVTGGAAAPLAPSPTAPVSGADDPLDRLEKLNDLRLSGVLSDAEFQAAKAKILGS